VRSISERNQDNRDASPVANSRFSWGHLWGTELVMMSRQQATTGGL